MGKGTPQRMTRTAVASIVPPLLAQHSIELASDFCSEKSRQLHETVHSSCRAAIMLRAGGRVEAVTAPAVASVRAA